MHKMKGEIHMELLILILVIGVLIVAMFRFSQHEKSIREYVESMGGQLIRYERRSIFSGLGPFHVVGKGRVVYSVHYRLNGQDKEGFVRFGSLFGPDWRM